MIQRKKKNTNNAESELLYYQPDAIEIEEKPVPGKIRWVLYLILVSIVMLIIGSIIFHVDRIVATEGELITTTPPLLVQPIDTAVVRTILVKVGERVEKDQVLATLDPTFTDADLNQLTRRRLNLAVQLRRITAELAGAGFTPSPEEGKEGLLQSRLLQQRQKVLQESRQMSEDRIAALTAKLELGRVKRAGLERQKKLLRDVEGTTARLPQNRNSVEARLRLLEAQKARTAADNEYRNLLAEEQVTLNEIREAKSQFQRFVEERNGELMEQQVGLLAELEEVEEGLRKATRLHDLDTLRAPAKGIVLEIAKRPSGSVLQPAEPFITLVPMDCDMEVEVKVQSKDIGRIRTGDLARVKLDAFPFQRHGTLDGTVRVISEDAYQQPYAQQTGGEENGDTIQLGGFYKARLRLASHQLKNVPPGFRLMPGMKARAEIKVGKRRVISYFLYPIIRALDEGLREP